MVLNRYATAAKSLLATVDINMNNIRNWAILDSEATSYFLVTQAPDEDIAPALRAMHVRLPNRNLVTTSHTCSLKIPNLPTKARLAHIVPGVDGFSLISIVTLYNAGCEVHLKDISCKVSYRGKTIISAVKCTTAGL